MYTQYLILYQSVEPYAPTVLHITVDRPVDGYEDSILRRLRSFGFDTDQVIWLTDEQKEAMIKGEVTAISLLPKSSQ